MPQFDQLLNNSELVLMAGMREENSPGELMNSKDLQDWHRKNRHRMTRNRNKSGRNPQFFDRTAKEGVLKKFSIELDSEKDSSGGLQGQKTQVKVSSG